VRLEWHVRDGTHRVVGMTMRSGKLRSRWRGLEGCVGGADDGR
jgi:hypothetical protein